MWDWTQSLSRSIRSVKKHSRFCLNIFSLKAEKLLPSHCVIEVVSLNPDDEQNCYCCLGRSDGVILSPFDPSDAKQSWASVNSCMRKSVDSAFILGVRVRTSSSLKRPSGFWCLGGSMYKPSWHVH